MAKRRADIGRSLTDQQRRAAQDLVANEFCELSSGKKLTKDELAERIGISRSTLYEWMKIPEFNEYHRMISRDKLHAHGSEVDAALIKLIRMPEPRIKAIELWYKLQRELADVHVIEHENESKLPRKSDAEIAADIHKLAEMVNGEE
ncbi:MULTISPECIES: phBC6A51 family helix-turn-helix protein [unclassified Brevibacillus]|uniref:phBC6A51 family helix-turn-helix protein n=1 Tax=unclassified Brevibacillus TaxID=2684853 RepID=UPI003561BE2F